MLGPNLGISGYAFFNVEYTIGIRYLWTSEVAGNSDKKCIKQVYAVIHQELIT